MENKKIIFISGFALIMVGGAAFSLYKKTSYQPGIVIPQYNTAASPVMTPDMLTTTPAPVENLSKLQQAQIAVNKDSKYIGVPIAVGTSQNPQSVTFIQPQNPQSRNVTLVPMNIAQLNKKTQFDGHIAEQQKEKLLFEMNQKNIELSKLQSNTEYKSKEIVPPHVAKYMINLKQQEFDENMKMLALVIPSSPNPEQLKKQIAAYKDFNKKLNSYISAKNVTYAMFKEYDDQTHKLFNQISGIHKTNSNFHNKNAITPVDTDEEYSKKMKINPNHDKPVPNGFFGFVESKNGKVYQTTAPNGTTQPFSPMNQTKSDQTSSNANPNPDLQKPNGKSTSNNFK